MLDVIEIDGASNNGVENVRELIERARFEPTQGKYKIYIIDEVHMLSTGAFNALLKTLEEPPAHVKFILATTEIEKVPETIRSRSLEFDFKKFTEKDIVQRLEFVTKSEWIQAETEALAIIAKAARGGMRDALTLLEQHTTWDTLSTEYVRNSLSLLEDSLIEEILDGLARSDTGKILTILDTLRSRHVQVRGFFDQMLLTLRDKMFEHIADSEFVIYEEIFRVFEDAYSKIKVIPDGWLLIEITLLRGVKRNALNHETWSMKREKQQHTPQVSEKSTNIPTPKIIPDTAKETVHSEWTVTKKTEPLPQQAWQEQESSEPTSLRAHQSPSPPISESTSLPFSYPRLLQSLKEKKPALVVDLKIARFSLGEDGTTKVLTLIFPKKWNYDRVSTASTQNIICETLEELYSGQWKINCTLEEWNNAHIVDDVF